MKSNLGGRSSPIRPKEPEAIDDADRIRAYHYARAMLGQNTIDISLDRAIAPGYGASNEDQ